MTTSLAPVWRPLHDQPLFVPELLHGPSALPDDLREQIMGYLTQVAETRNAPLHTCTAFNALHFGYDLQTRGYRAEVLDPALFVLLESGRERPMLPVGTFVRIDRGGRRSLWAEVIARYGADEAVEADGWVPADLSGAPSTAPDGSPAVARERVVLDVEAFGAPLSAAEQAELNRLRRRSTLLDHRGHLTGSVTVPVDGPDVRDDISWYARQLLTSAQPLLIGGPLGGLLTEPLDEQILSTALHQALATIAALLDHEPGLRRWQHYTLPAHRYETHRRTGWPDLAADDVDDVVNTMVRASGQPRYTAVWPLLAARAGDNVGPDPLSLSGAAQLITHVNLAAAELASTAAGGLLPGGAHLRIDDVWQAGGVWRTQRQPMPASILATDPSIPLGLGHRPAPAAVSNPIEPRKPSADSAARTGDTRTSGTEGPADDSVGDPDTADSTFGHDRGGELWAGGSRARTAHNGPQGPASGPKSRAADEPIGDSRADDPDEGAVNGEITDVAIADNLVVYTVALRETHLETDVLPLQDAAAAVLADGPLLVELHHLGESLEDTERLHAAERFGAALSGIAWPLSFYPGIKVTVAVARAGRRVSALTTLLGEPLPLGERYRWDADLAILAAALGVQRPPAPAQTGETGDTAADARADGRPHRLRGVDQLRGLIVAALRRHGIPGEFGARRLDGPQLRAALFGPDTEDPDLLRQVVYTCEQLTSVP